MREKKILLITENLGAGGAERQMCGLSTLLTKSGYPCRLITYSRNQFYEPFLVENNVDYELVESLLPPKTRIFRMVKYVNSYKPDVIISFLQSVNLTLCLAKLFYNSRLIVSERNNNTCVTFRDRVLFNLYRMADAVVPNSFSQGDFIKQHFQFLSNKIHPIINFVDLKRFSPTGNPASNQIPRILTVARYAQQKNLFTYLKAVQKIKSLGIKVHFDWFGSKSYDSEYYKQIEAEYQKLNIGDYLTLHGPEHNIENEYNKSDIFLLPSLYEGYPNVLVEAMACGLPVICSNRYENPYIVTDGINGYLFDPENVDDIVKTIRKVVSLTPEEKHKIGKRNRQICLERNAEKTFLQSYVNLIESL